MTRMNHHRRSSSVVLIVMALVMPQMNTAQTGRQPAQVSSDALVFRGSDLAAKQHLDIYAAIPYECLSFQSVDNRFAAQCTTQITVRDLVGRRLADTTIIRSVVASSYAETQGASGTVEVLMVRFPLTPGTVRYELEVDDAFSRRSYQQVDTVEITDLFTTPAFSSLMYVTDVEQRGTRYTVKPYIGSSIWSKEQQLFTFFEWYIDDAPQVVAFQWVIADADGKRLGRGMSDPTTITRRSSQHFLPLRPIEQGTSGTYQLIVTAHPVINGRVDTTNVMARRERTYVIPRSVMTSVVGDIKKAIRQMAYVADGDVIDALLAIENGARQQEEFEAFWKRLDPTPNTTRNEAFDEYFGRIATANERFRSYAEGWQTDMGRVFVVYGEPLTIQQFTSQGGVMVAVRWTYPNNYVFTFEDPSGFGDFRLRSGFPPRSRYEYGR